MLNFLKKEHPILLIVNAGFLIVVSLVLASIILALNWREQISQFHPLAWSPDGKYLAFGVEIDSSRTDIFVISADGTNLVPIANGLNRNELRLGWSEDSETLYFSERLNTNRVDVMYFEVNPIPTTSNYRGLYIQPITTNNYRNVLTESVQISRTNHQTDLHEARSVCNDPRYDNPAAPYDECEKDLEVYLVETGKLLWTFSGNDYDRARMGFLYPVFYLMIIFIGLCVFVSSILLTTAIGRTAWYTVKMLRRYSSDSHKPKPKREILE
ncbi:MAG: hypothetical protein AAF846_09325 [Chloroflexota bacterium]